LGESSCCAPASKATSAGSNHRQRCTDHLFKVLFLYTEEIERTLKADSSHVDVLRAVVPGRGALRRLNADIIEDHTFLRVLRPIFRVHPLW
jgi:hypothetical protein